MRTPVLKTLRVVFGVLLILPLALLLFHIFFQADSSAGDALSELIYLVFGLPIMVLNAWAWLEPEVIEFYFLGITHKETAPD